MIKSSQLKKSGLFCSVAGVLAIAFAGASLPVMAQDGSQQANQEPQIQALESVAAVVNDKVISTFDLRQRIQLIALTSGGQIPESAMAQVQAKALQDLIEEQLKLAEAESVDFDVDPEEVDQELAGIAANSGNTIEQLEQQLNAVGISIETLRRQIRTRLVWQQLVAGRYSSRVRISDSEIDAVMNRLRAESQDEQYLVSEICLPVRENFSTAQIEQAGMQIIQQMQQGTPFEAMARQFSVCSSAANGGDLGWLRAGEMEPELGNVVRQMAAGNVSRPIALDGTVRILAVRETREAAEQGVKSYELGYASAPASMSREEVAEITSKLPQTNICAGDALSIDLGQDVDFELLPMIPASRMQEPFRAPAEQLERGEVSEPIRSGDSWHAILLCAKDDGLGLPSRGQIEDRLFAQELDLISRRYLRDVERDSSVQILLGNNGPQNQNG
ncbi:peptidylprolyl isomerase [Aquisalinus flavus]|uniref:Parvulin-like PPIase n=1 Tax=Aquisalinus flavus TaxID=1526572 RepID=A0A8J2V1U1_9PROT|nr:peptidylprolyl isomerase [Aquisalinus flavus]MBD0427914.1 peptidylprolyl isomerase [Aquisalinus flavus]GGD04889.1 chaperone SurA [Aquisalinus flavus]